MKAAKNNTASKRKQTNQGGTEKRKQVRTKAVIEYFFLIIT